MMLPKFQVVLRGYSKCLIWLTVTVAVSIGIAGGYAVAVPALAGKSAAVSAPDLVAIKAAVRSVQPFLTGDKIDLYSAAIQQASLRYGIDPMVLIAITDQESDFREGHPEGKAGEIGLHQIRKTWLKNALFRAEFKKVTVKDLNNPSKSFFYAAWILKDLKKTHKASALPYWTKYNSPTLQFRQKYFALVNRKIIKIRNQESTYVAGTASSSSNFAH